MNRVFKHIRSIFAGMVFIFSLISCERTAHVTLPPHISSLVLHGYVAVGEIFTVSLGKSISENTLVNDSATYVSNGWMVLYQNGVFRDSLKYDVSNRIYVSNHIAASGVTYRILAGAPGFKSVETEATAPSHVNAITFNHIKRARSTSGGEFLDDITFSFRDSPSEKNYYLAAVYAPYSKSLCAYTFDPAIEKHSTSLLFIDESNCIRSTEILFTDKSFNGSLKEITISASSESLRTDVSNGISYNGFFKKFHITEQYYTYIKKTATLRSETNGSSFADPVRIKGNVKNGYGLFTLFTVTVDSLK